MKYWSRSGTCQGRRWSHSFQQEGLLPESHGTWCPLHSGASTSEQLTAWSPPAAQVPFTRAFLPGGPLLLAAWAVLPAGEEKMEAVIQTWAPRGSYHQNTAGGVGGEWSAHSLTRLFTSPFPLGDTVVCVHKATDLPL